MQNQRHSPCGNTRRCDIAIAESIFTVWTALKTATVEIGLRYSQTQNRGRRGILSKVRYFTRIWSEDCATIENQDWENVNLFTQRFLEIPIPLLFKSSSYESSVVSDSLLVSAPQLT